MPVRVVAGTGDSPCGSRRPSSGRPRRLRSSRPEAFRVDENFYVETKRVDAGRARRAAAPTGADDRPDRPGCGCSRSSPPPAWTAGCCSTSAAATRSPPRCWAARSSGSRRVYVLIPRDGTPDRAGPRGGRRALARLAGRSGPSGCGSRARSWRRSSATLVRGKRLAVDYSPNGAIPYLDGVPAGVAELLRGLGATLVPSAELVTRYCSVWTAGGRRLAPARGGGHRGDRAGGAGARRAAAARRQPISEHALAVWVRERFDRAGLVTESGPSVSWGPNAARAHYDPTGGGERAHRAAARCCCSTSGPRSRAGSTPTRPGWRPSARRPSGTRELWTVVRDARDAALDLIRAAGAQRRRRCAAPRPTPRPSG